ncbi:substrate-binding periplasmic protein [Chitinibacteraceae bacterium HSL-7]
MRLICFLLLLWPLLAVANRPIRLMTQQLEPYSVEVRGRQSGLALEVVRCALEQIKEPYVIQFVPWKRAQLLVATGEADGFFPATHNDRRDGLFTLSAPVAPLSWTWYTRTGTHIDPTTPAFKRYGTVGSYLGANMLTWLKDNGYNIVAVPESHGLLMRVLLAGRVDAVLAGDKAMETQLTRSGNAGRVQARPLMAKPLGVYFSRDYLNTRDDDLLNRFNAAIPRCHAKRPAIVNQINEADSGARPSVQR